jgi:hypothetical protein
MKKCGCDPLKGIFCDGDMNTSQTLNTRAREFVEKNLYFIRNQEDMTKLIQVAFERVRAETKEET